MMTAKPHRPMSLTARVMLFVALATSLCLFIVGMVVQTSIEHHFAEQDAEELQVVADAVQAVLQRTNPEQVPLASALSMAVSGHHGVYFQVTDKDGRTLYATPGADLSAAPALVTPVGRIQVASLETWREGDKTYRGAVLKVLVNQQHFTITTATDMDFHLHFLGSFGLTLWLIMAVAAALTLLAAWIGIHQGHSPLRELSSNIRSVQSDSLHVRLHPDTAPIELQDLVLSFNHMLGRLEEGFARLSNFSADIAHELRTPLTNLITQTQVGLSKARQQDEYRELLYSNLEEQERLAVMVGDMLWLAQTDHGLIKPVFIALDLAVEIRAVFEYFGAWAEEKQVRLILEGDGRPVLGDRAMLRRALSNLLSNAIRHTPAGHAVSVLLSSIDTAHVSLTVQNAGAEIPAEHLLKIFDRFYRVDPSRQRQSEGGGLGLAIVKSIIEVHGGKVEASSGGGLTTFIVVLPLSSSSAN